MVRGSHPGSPERINMTPILAAARIPVQMEFSVGTGVRCARYRGGRQVFGSEQRGSVPWDKQYCTPTPLPAQHGIACRCSVAASDTTEGLRLKEEVRRRISHTAELAQLNSHWERALLK